MLEKIMQATGNMFWPMIFQLVGALINIVVDPILIFGWFGLPAMGVTGAAIATVGGQILSMILAVVVVARHPFIRISIKDFRFHGSIVKDIYAVGIPAIVMQAISTVMNMAINAIGRGNYSLVMSLMRQLVVLVPVAWLLAKVTNDVGMVWWAFPIAEAVSLAVSMIFFTHLYKTELKK